MERYWPLPEGVWIRADGSWIVGALPVRHERSLAHLKSRLVFDDEGAYLVDGGQRLPVHVEGPAFEVVALRLDDAAGSARVVLDDGSEEPIVAGSLGIDPRTGSFECAVRGGRARARLSRAAHQTLIERVDESEGGFSLRVGARRIPLRT